jgi:hypothetical protein
MRLNMKNVFTILMLVILTVILSIGCSEDKDDSNPTGPGNGEAGDMSSLGGQPAPSSIASDNFNGVMATISYDIATVPGFPSVSTTIAFATFGEGVDAGAVIVNNNTLGKSTESGSTFYIVPSPSNPTATVSNVNFNGSAHNWSVGGGNGIPALSGSVNSPSQFNLNAPSNNSTVSKSAGFDVTWTTSGSSNAKILVLVTQVNNGNYFSADELDDDGSYTVSASSLSEISGEAMLQAVKYTYNAINNGGKDYYMISEIVKSVNITVN